MNKDLPADILSNTFFLGGTGSEQGGTGCQCDMLSDNVWFTWRIPLNHSIFGEGKSDDGQMDRQTDRQTNRFSI